MMVDQWSAIASRKRCDCGQMSEDGHCFSCGRAQSVVAENDGDEGAVRRLSEVIQRGVQVGAAV